MYGSEIEQPGLRVDGVYQINEEFRAVADFGFYLPDETDLGGGNTLTITWWELNFNGNYIFHNDEESGLQAYALAGLNITGISSEFDGGGDSSDSETGLNLGAGIEYGMSFGNLFGEAKMANVGGDADQFVVGVGVRFPVGGN
ncbi:outer membrane protein [Gracilimonas halophila]|uniref:Outer membrane protein n=1 Tax=Gracilimonas halophila TaxID=1834464 RepID=A0ABW5JH80_9BACT